MIALILMIGSAVVADRTPTVHGQDPATTSRSQMERHAEDDPRTPAVDWFRARGAGDRAPAGPWSRSTTGGPEHAANAGDDWGAWKHVPAPNAVPGDNANANWLGAGSTNMAANFGLRAVGQDQQNEGPPVQVSMFTPFLQWRTLPSVTVQATLRRDGEDVALANGFSDENGRAILGFFGAAGANPIRPGDEITLVVGDDEDSLTVEVPTLAADIDPNADRIEARAPADTEVAVELYSSDRSGDDPPTLTRAATADADGRIRVDLGGSYDVLPGDHGVVMLDIDQQRFIARFAALRVELQAGDPFAMARATIGTTVTLTVLAPNDEIKWSASVRAQGGFPGSGRASAVQFQIAPRTSGPPGPGRPGQSAPIEVGDRLEVDRSDGLISVSPYSTTVPALSIDLGRRAGHVSGTGPVSATLGLNLLDPYGRSTRTTVATDEDGAFDVEVQEPIGPGWRATLDAQEGPFRIVARGAIPRVQIGVHTTQIQGVNVPGRPVTATLRDAGGATIGSWSTTAGRTGSFGITLMDSGSTPRDEPTPHRVRPGDILEVDLAGGDPVTMVIPEISAASDADAETVSGVAPIALEARLTVDGGLEETSFGLPVEAEDGPLLDVPVDIAADGRYSVDLSEHVAPDGTPFDLEPPLFGSLIASREDGHQYVLRWSPVAMTVRMGAGIINGTGPGGRAVHAELMSSAGELVASNRGSVDLGGIGTPIWYASLVDELGQPITPQAGDTIRVQVGEDRAELRVPRLDGVVHVEADRVSGGGTPGASLELAVFGTFGQQHSIEGAVADDGTFAFELADEGIDIRYNWAVNVTMAAGRHRVIRDIRAPGLSLNLDSGQLYGSSEAGKETILTLSRDGRTLDRHEFVANELGVFVTGWSDAAGAPIRPQAGDVIRLEIPDATTAETSVSMTVPDLTIDYALGDNQISGLAPADARLTIGAGPVFPGSSRPGLGGQAQVEIAEDGSYVAAFENPNFEIQHGMRFSANLQLASGHSASRSRTVPVLNVQHGGSAVCGYSDGPADVSLGLEDPTGRADGRSNELGYFALSLTDDGRPAITQPGSRVRATLGPSAMEVTLPITPIQMTVDWDRLRVTGEGPPNRRITLTLPGAGCPADGQATGFFGPSVNGQTDESGRFELTVPPWFRDFLEFEGLGVEVAFTTEDGHRFFLLQRRPQVEVLMGTSMIRGTGTPLGDLGLELREDSGEVVGAAETVVGAFGTFEASLVDAAGAPARISGTPEGRTLVVDHGGRETEIPLIPLAFDFSVDGGLAGTTRAAQDVQVRLTLAEDPARLRRQVFVTMTADDDGRFEILEEPARSDWSFEDVRGIRVSIPVPGGHELVTELELAPPAPVLEPVYLPWARRVR